MLKEQKKLFWTILAYAAVLVMLVGIINYALVGRISGAAQEYLSNQEDIVKIDRRRGLFKEMEKEYQAREARFAELNNIFLKPEDTIGFITDLEKVAEQTNNIFEIQSVSSIGQINKEKQDRPYLGFRINLWGDFNGLINFLANLEDSPYPPYRLVEINDFRIKKLEKVVLTEKYDPRIKSGDLETTLDIKIYTE